MKGLFDKFIRGQAIAAKLTSQEQTKRRVAALFSLLSGLYGADRLVMRAGKLEALDLMRSENVAERVLALQRLTFGDPTYDRIPTGAAIPAALDEIEEEMADQVARRSVEDKIERRVAEKMQERHEDYVKEIKAQVLREEYNVENPQTLKKYALLEKLEQRKLNRSAMTMLRPASLDEIVGQERAVQALKAKLASPYPQHMLLYGPPGVGKTTAARLVLEEAKKLRYTPFAKDAPFVEVDGATLRWDPRDMTNPLLGSVHDPIYQGARRDLADLGVPEPKPGLVTEAHGGVLFIDEIGEMDPLLLNKLLKVLEDKRVKFDSAYYDPSDPNVPKYIKKLFAEGAPADFILIGATTRDAEDINPAIRSRCTEIFFEPLTPQDIQEIVRRAAVKLNAAAAPEVAALISDYTIEGRKAVNMLADAYGQALYRTAAGEPLVITRDDVMQVAQTGRLTPYTTDKASAVPQVGRIFGLGVAGYLGAVLEIEAVAFAAEKGKGQIRFNDTAGSMAKDSVFNAAAVVRKLLGLDLANFDVHINVVGGGRIDGPSAGAAILMAIISALTQRPLRQDVAVTGEISLQGRVKPVGGVFEKAYGAKQAGMRTMVIPADNARDIPANLLGLQICPAATAEQVMEKVFADGGAKQVKAS